MLQIQSPDPKLSNLGNSRLKVLEKDNHKCGKVRSLNTLQYYTFVQSHSDGQIWWASLEEQIDVCAQL
jgi:hypothetical protein